jgi:sulfonate transport system substrate-binding protein
MKQHNHNSIHLPRRQVLLGLGLAGLGLAAPAIVRAQSAKVIRLGAPDFGVGDKSSAGGALLTIVQQNKWLEEEFAKDGVKIEWHFFRGAGPAVAEALSARQLDIVSLGDLASVLHRSRGLPTRLIVPGGRDTHSYLATAPGSTIRSVADLKGRKVAVLKGTAYQRPFDKLLASAGLSEKDIKLINMDWPSSKAAVVAGQIDATFGGSDLFLLKDKGVEIALSTKGRGPGFTISSGILGTEEFIQGNPQWTQRLARQLVRAAHWASQDANREALIRLYAGHSGSPEIVYRAELEGENLAARYSPLIDEDFVANYQGVLDDGLKLGLVRQGFDIPSWFEPRFVQQALKDFKLEKQWTARDAQGKGKVKA